MTWQAEQKSAASIGGYYRGYGEPGGSDPDEIQCECGRYYPPDEMEPVEYKGEPQMACWRCRVMCEYCGIWVIKGEKCECGSDEDAE